MKKLILSFTLVALAFVPALQAGEGKTCDKAKAAECTASKTACASKAACAEKSAAACCAKYTATKKSVDGSQKGAMLLVQK